MVVSLVCNQITSLTTLLTSNKLMNTNYFSLKKKDTVFFLAHNIQQTKKFLDLDDMSKNNVYS